MVTIPLFCALMHSVILMHVHDVTCHINGMVAQLEILSLTNFTCAFLENLNKIIMVHMHVYMHMILKCTL